MRRILIVLLVKKEIDKRASNCWLFFLCRHGIKNPSGSLETPSITAQAYRGMVGGTIKHVADSVEKDFEMKC